MSIHEFELVAIIILIFGMYVFVKGQLSFTLTSGESGESSILDEKSKTKTLKEINFGPIGARLFGIVLILAGAFLFVYFKGKVLFVL